MRYAWQPSVDVRTSLPPAVVKMGARVLQAIDRRSVEWTDVFAGISSAVKERILRFYGRDADVIHPPVHVEFFSELPTVPLAARKDFALAVSRFVPYKRLDFAIRVCGQLGHRLVVAGYGPDEGRLRETAARFGDLITFEIQPSDRRLRSLYRYSQFLLFPSHEDFGIVPVECQAAGTSVLAVDEGGSRDTVVDGVTGRRTNGDTLGDFAQVIRSEFWKKLSPKNCRAHASQFSRGHFQSQIRQWVNRST